MRKRLRSSQCQRATSWLFSTNGQEQTLAADAILVAVGRTPNVEGLDLEEPE